LFLPASSPKRSRKIDLLWILKIDLLWILKIDRAEYARIDVFSLAQV
jgi:hypothetical protein